MLEAPEISGALKFRQKTRSSCNTTITGRIDNDAMLEEISLERTAV
jgi:hypothetical protein